MIKYQYYGGRFQNYKKEFLKMKQLEELELLRGYLKGIRIPLKFAIGLNSHIDPDFPWLGYIPTSMWDSQIPTFEEFKKDCGDDRYDWRLKKSFHSIKING
jgi:hypothetical protein